MTTLESLNARLNLIGSVAASASSAKDDNITEKGSITLQYENDTSFKLRVRVESKISGDMNDYDADQRNAHWYLNTRWTIKHLDGTIESNYDNDITEISELEHLGTILGYGGSNNKQYDHHTWDTINGFAYFNLMPGDIIEYKAIGVLDDDAGGNYEVTLKEKEINLIIAGALEI